MSEVYESKWVRQIAGLQQDDGSWGYFHTLSQPTKTRPITTEQALRRLRILGLTKDDAPVTAALRYMRECLKGERRPPDGREKVLNWDAFEAHMLATWIRIFEPDDPLAAPIAEMWADIITKSFRNGALDGNVYETEYRRRIPVLNYGERMIMIPQFYMVNLLKGALDTETERRFVDYIINNKSGIYYIYGSAVAIPPTEFASRKTSFYLGALEQIAGYACAGEKLAFAVKWLSDHKDADGGWDLGAAGKDGVYLPLSDSWRKPEDRKRDCTERITRLLKWLE